MMHEKLRNAKWTKQIVLMRILQIFPSSCIVLFWLSRQHSVTEISRVFSKHQYTLPHIDKMLSSCTLEYVYVYEWEAPSPPQTDTEAI